MVAGGTIGALLAVRCRLGADAVPCHFLGPSLLHVCALIVKAIDHGAQNQRPNDIGPNASDDFSTSWTRAACEVLSIGGVQ